MDIETIAEHSEQGARHSRPSHVKWTAGPDQAIYDLFLAP